MIDNEKLLKELLHTFRLEAEEHLGALSSLLIELERESEPAGQKRLVESAFRRIHTLKGAAHAVNRVDVALVCQELESLFADLKRGDLQLDLPLFDRIHAELNELSEVVLGQGTQRTAGTPGTENKKRGDSTAEGPPTLPASSGSEETLPEAATAAATPQTLPLSVTLPAPHHSALQPAPAPKGAPDETVRVSTKLLESLLLQAEELVTVKLAASALHEELAAVAAELSARAGERARARDLSREALRKREADPVSARLAKLVEQNCDAGRLLENRLRDAEKRAEKHLWGVKSLVDPLLEDIKKLHLLPLSSLTAPFAKLVRDLGRELGKQAELSCSGDEIELDRRILAELKEPLLHIVRNMMDHGIEEPAERLAKGKEPKGSLRIAMRLQDANQAEIVLSDDGRGIDPSRVREAARGLELLPDEALEAISDHEALQLVFESGLSTSGIVTTISGRGLGLAIVRESVERLGGHVTLSSVRGGGTEFRLLLPLSFAMMRALQVETRGRRCMIPGASVELTARVAPEEIRRVENRDTILLNGELISLVSLAHVLELGERGGEAPEGFQPVVLLVQGEKRVAFAVDQVVGVQEILVKPLGRQLSRVRNVAGATVLGDGRVVPILNTGDIFRSALLSAGAPLFQAPPQAPRPKRLSVLVAEDSVTSRTLLKNILESSGYAVATAIDGADALTQLKAGEFDLVISDVEMPRMDGFQLTAALRGERRFENLPVILVTGLESRSDRERGIEVGANAYIVKSSFDQGGLVDVIRKFT